MRILVILHPWFTSPAERDDLVAAATRLGAPVEAIVVTGNGHPAAIADRLAQDLRADNARTLVILPAGTEGQQIAALVAAACGGDAPGRCSRIALEEDAVVVRRAIFGGRAEAALRSNSRVVCVALRPDAIAQSAQPAEVQRRELAIDLASPFEAEPVAAPSSHPGVEGAPMVVSGGRGIGGAEGFELLARIAGALGAGLGGSLPAVDAGWVPVAHQIGQSGKFVAPKLYFAVGISGTPQHLAGLAPTARVVALNSAPDAPIFERSDIGVVADWREILPLLVARLEAGVEPRTTG